jgi:drug/metabolite transporter (DMT)-like permease
MTDHSSPLRTILITTILLCRSSPIHAFQHSKISSYSIPPSLSSDFVVPVDETSDYEARAYSDSIHENDMLLKEQQVLTSDDMLLKEQQILTSDDMLLKEEQILTSDDMLLKEQLILTSDDSASLPVLEQFMNSYLGPRLLLAAVACLYGTNFPLGSIMDHALPASAATSARFFLASLALSPYIFQIRKELVGYALLAGCFTGMGYVAQSLALVDTSPATVSFLGAVIVIWCPFLEWLVDKKPMGIHDRPQTWMAVVLCMLGVGILELCGGGAELSSHAGVGMGDALGLLQALGFGTGLFMSDKMMQKHSDQALPVTAVLVATTAFISMLWVMADGWMWNTPNWESMTLPNLLFDPSMREVAAAVVWTGLISTSLNFFLEVFSLQKVSSGEASVILATEPLWASAFAAVILGESFGWNDYVGGVLIVSACLVNGLTASDFQGLLPGVVEQENENKQ